jgi:GNAT superfamily N-acetyltransferase
VTDPGAGAIAIRTASDADRPALESLYREFLPGGERVVRVFRWRDRGAPASGGNHPALAFEGDALCGVVNAVHVTLASRGERVAAAWQGDSLVHPGWRGRGLGKRLVNAAGHGRAILVAKSTSPSMYGLRKSLGFVDLANAEYLVRALRPWPPGSLPRRAALARLWLRSLAVSPPPIPADVELAPLGRFDAAFDDLAERVAAREEVAPVKTAAYLAARYSGAPDRAYLITRADTRAGLVGAVVLRPPAEPGGDAWLVDLVAEPDDPGAAALVALALRAAHAAGAGALKTFATAPAARRLLFAFGFVATRVSPRFTCLVRDARLADWPARPWNVWHGDSDGELY